MINVCRGNLVPSIKTDYSFFSGTNKFASQKGMSFGSSRHGSDIKADDMSRESQGIINLQAGSNQHASQKGMAMGRSRHAADITSEAMVQESQGTINLQAGKEKL